VWVLRACNVEGLIDMTHHAKRETGFGMGGAVRVSYRRTEATRRGLEG
jgi:hypothetical protein